MLSLRIVAGLALASASLSASACRCEQRPLHEYFAAADTVAIGILAGSEIAADGDRRLLQFTLTDDAYKGSARSGNQLTYSSLVSSAGCGVTGTPGSVFVLFGYTGTANFPHIDTCSGTRPLRTPAGTAASGFVDVPTKFVNQQLLALAGLLVLRELSARHPDPTNPRSTALIGLLDIQALSHGGTVPVYDVPNPAGEKLTRIESLDAVYSREAGYEFAAAEVYARNEFGYRIRLKDGRYGWIKDDGVGTWFSYDELPVNRLSYLTGAWSGFMWPEPGAGLPSRTALPEQDSPVEVSANVLKSARIAGSLWFYVERLSGSRCDEKDVRILSSGWIPAYSITGAPTVWFYSRGC